MSAEHTAVSKLQLNRNKEFLDMQQSYFTRNTKAITGHARQQWCSKRNSTSEQRSYLHSFQDHAAIWLG